MDEKDSFWKMVAATLFGIVVFGLFFEPYDKLEDLEEDMERGKR